MPVAFLLRYWKAGALVLALLAAWAYLSHVKHAAYKAGEAANELAWAAKVSAARQDRIADYERQLVAARVRQTEQEAASATLAGRLTDEQANSTKLLQALSRARLTHATPTTDGTCPVVRFSNEFRGLFNQAVTGTAGPASTNPGQ